ncbi:uncharacterized protein N7483_008345 [Penicillium malachiteum]|uniref:uncharacterized protein n=1 Tax=Penicillium malachiteum TaxID=1324776 RepID=UPI0025478056|nr:uncharacterized protein N7483_008345 [Penicillium malachiteum]KAJ5720411.1 hypothetical protein N7483_008345 [Penicillium malachiteum]
MKFFAHTLIGGAVGVTCHLLLFIHHEWHLRAPDLLCYHLIVIAIVGATLDKGLWMLLGYLICLFSSIIIYRIFFHRLKHFPGPAGARITKIWHTWKLLGQQNHLLLKSLHHQYGDFVRTGPSEITVYHPDVFMAIDGPQSNCVKAEWYDLLSPNQSLVTARTKRLHGARRRQWNRGFTSQALDQYQSRLIPLIDQLERCIDGDITAEKASEMTDLLYWIGFDRMGDFIFSRTFNMLSRQKWHHVIVLLQRALSLLGPLSPLPWFLHLCFKLFPRIWILKDWFQMVSWCEMRLTERLDCVENIPKALDVAHYLLEDARENPHQFPWLTGDSILAIVAGSEPIAAVLVGLFCEIYQEVERVDISDGARSLGSSCPHLEGAILEALRLYPALPTGGNRKTLKNGITIGGTFIPPETTIVAPRFCISRREDCFEQAHTFLPERWYKTPRMIRNKAAFSPFGTGKYSRPSFSDWNFDLFDLQGHTSCLGRTLAMNDMRLITARLVRRYRFSVPDGETMESVWRDLKDQFTSNPGRLRLFFELREDCIVKSKLADDIKPG